ncbi:MAG: isoprenylcysteine carboxylmethyltransferase family protein [Gemmatimonadota bacterium]
MRFVWIALRALVYLMLLGSLFGLVALSLRDMDTQLGAQLPAGMRTMGASVMAAGAVLALWCAFIFVARGEGTPAPFDPPRRFVVRGPYRWVRNPMVIGVLAVMLGFGLWNLSVSIVLFSAVVAVCIGLFVILVEEPGLSARFGSEYEDYRASVSRWIPRKPPSRE